MDVRGARALVTGGGAGIGRATCEALACAGASVVVSDVIAERAELVAAGIRSSGGDAVAEHLDVTDADAVDALAARLPVDVLVCNAGVGMSGRLTDMGHADWSWIRSVNLDGVVQCCRAFGPAMLARGRGHAVIVSSGLAYTPRATEPAYVATKAAVLALAQCLRADWGRSGVGVTAVCPGFINTDIATSTRYLGVDPSRQARNVALFQRSRAPERVAVKIVEAVARDRAVVPVGWEARLGWWAHRLSPLRVQQLVARQQL